jgi:two-component system, OmpR family, phosphate regulon sensor histidine kinase PhoR
VAKGESILLALDPSPVHQLLERALRAAGYQVISVHDQAGLEKTLAESNPALMLIGEHLAERSGLKIGAQIMDRFPTLPVILFAERSNPELAPAALKAGLSDVLFPPVRTEDIVRSINQSKLRARRVGDWVRQEVKHTTATLQKRIDELETLVKVSHSITGTLELDRVLSSVVSAAVDLSGAEEGHLLLLDEPSGELYMRAERNLGEQYARTFRLRADDSLAGQVLRTGEPIALNTGSPQKIKTAYLVHSLIYVPVRSHERVIGVLGVDNRESNHPFREHYVLLLSILADYAAIAIQNARLYQETENERSKLLTTLQNIDDGVIVLNDDLRIIYINPSARRIFSLGIAGLTGRLLFDIINHPDLRGLIDSVRENPLKFHEVTFEDGRVFYAHYAPISGVGIAITLQEITHLKMLDRLKSDFIHTVSHDLRSPLTSIMGYVELLERVGALNDQQRDFVRRIQSSAKDITYLVNELLDLGRIEAGFDTHRDRVQLEDILRYTLENVAKQAEDKSITLVNKTDGQGMPVMGNPIRLRQVVDNLVSNAVKYTPTGGTVTAKLSLEGDQVVFSVADTGVGIPAADQPHIFEKFYRASNAPKGSQGAGLGLAIVKSIVENHEGRIWVESVPGLGTTFYVVLPGYKSLYREPPTVAHRR